MEIGYILSREEQARGELVRNARRAEEAGFGFALISDHYHPWIDRQGHSPFVWRVIGAIAESTETLRLGTWRHLSHGSGCILRSSPSGSDGCVPHAGCDHVYVHQGGPNQQGFLGFYAREVLAEARQLVVRRPVAVRAGLG